MRIWTLACAAMLVLGATAAAEDRKPVDIEVPSDEQFVQTVSSKGMAEVEIAKHVADKTSNADVKKFAQMLVDDHSKANKQLAELADKKKIAVAKEMEKKHREMADRMAKLSGGDLDRTFANDMVKGHEDSIALFESFSKNGNDADLKDWAAKTLPTLKEHLKMAKDLADKVKGS